MTRESKVGVQFTETPGFPEAAAKARETRSNGKGKAGETPFESMQRRLQHGVVQSGDRFVKPNFPKEAEEDCDRWLAGRELSDPWPVVSWFVEQGLGVSVKRHDEGQYCCTISDAARLAADQPHLLSGFGPDLATSVFVALYKHEVLLEGVWDNVDRCRPAPRKYR